MHARLCILNPFFPVSASLMWYAQRRHILCFGTSLRESFKTDRAMHERNFAYFNVGQLHTIQPRVRTVVAVVDEMTNDELQEICRIVLPINVGVVSSYTEGVEFIQEFCKDRSR